MTHRTRIKASYIIGYQGGEHRLLRDGVVVVIDDRIEYVGPSIDVDADETVDLAGHVLAPGFVSTHGHYASSPFERGLRGDWCNPALYMSGLYEQAVAIGQGVRSSEDARIAAMASMIDLIRSGVTTGVDLTSWPQATERAALDLGFRAYIGPYVRSATWVTDGHSVTYASLGEDRESAMLDSALEFVRSHHAGNSLVTGMLAPAQLDTCRPDLLRRIQQVASEEGFQVQVHAAQSVVEFREMLARTGQTPVGFMADLGILDEHLIVAHCIFVGGHSWTGYPANSDVELLARAGASVAHCPWVFARYGQGMETLGNYLASGVNVSIGIDTAPQSMLAEMKIAVTASRLLQRDGRSVSAKDVFDAATLGGARALRRDDLGRIAEGCKADLVGYDLRSVRMSPVRDPIRNIVYAATQADVSFVLIDGSAVLSNGRLHNVEERAVQVRLQEVAENVWSQLPQHDHAKRSVDQMCPPSLDEWEYVRSPAQM